MKKICQNHLSDLNKLSNSFLSELDKQKVPEEIALATLGIAFITLGKQIGLNRDEAEDLIDEMLFIIEN